MLTNFQEKYFESEIIRWISKKDKICLTQQTENEIMSWKIYLVPWEQFKKVSKTI